MASEAIDFTAGTPVRGDLEVRWIHGSPRGSAQRDPAFQVHAYDPHTFLVRQSKDVSFEAPFLFLLFGNERAILLDTGADRKPDGTPLRDLVDGLVADWLSAHPREDYGLVVAHTHGHGDHVAGDAQFEGRPGTVIVGREPEAVQEFFGFADWPTELVRLDLGGRVLEVTGIPGHHPASIAVYDPWTGFLLTGDTVLPGRLYAFDYPAFCESMDRLVALAADRPVTHVLGCHIEMTRQPGRDYPLGCAYQPDEPPLQMTPAQLTEVRDAARQAAAKAGTHTFGDFKIMNGAARHYLPALMARGLWAKLRR